MQIDGKMVLLHVTCFTMLNFSMAGFIVCFKLNKDNPSDLRLQLQTWMHAFDAIFTAIFQVFVAYILIKAVTPNKEE